MDPSPSDEPAPRRSSRPADFGPGLRLGLRLAGATFAVALALVLLDVLAGVRLPPAVRPALPYVLVAATVVGTTLLVGALGTPRRPGDGTV
ncbi:MAG TPA: hypothetical protein VF576_04395 [Rubricoccaceae bacterium]